ncbi:MAG: HAMP domain-containing histidine kinase [Lachnospiraceae bacterium]|nr:HAMP domain-containing histidine kinase [Lachnospiraceae bacterium]
MKERRVKYSLKRQMAKIFILLMSGTIFLCWFVNVFFLEKYYVQYKKDNLLEVYYLLLEVHSGDSLKSGEIEQQLSNLCSIYNVNFIVTDSSSQTLYSTYKDPQQINMQLRDIVFERDNQSKKIITATGDYTLSYIKDPYSKTEYLTMWGNLDADCFFMIRTALDSIRDSVHMSNAFLLYVGLAAILLAGIVIWVVTSKITDPLMKLADISKQMANLNFETKYEGNSRNEIAVLGENMNLMSDRLEETISHLKTANLELQKDVESRRNADERRREFIANVSHELKTPIALIQGYAEGLKEGIIDDRESLDYYCDVIMDETHKMNHLVKRLISLSQVESGADAMQMERFDINDLIVHCIQSFAPLTEQQGITITYEECSGMYVWADEYQTEEVLRNYISNAVHHCSGEKEIVVKAECNEDGRHVRIRVFNTGDPIPEESLERIWDKFYKVDKARTREYGGSGLGLSIVKAIMESMKQDFGVQNCEDGVEFWFELENGREQEII